jgi:hypothetical protein
VRRRTVSEWFRTHDTESAPSAASAVRRGPGATAVRCLINRVPHRRLLREPFSFPTAIL